MKPRFVLCIGASKSGTTWLYNYLAASPFARMGVRKEYGALNQIYQIPKLEWHDRPKVLDSAFGAKLAQQRDIVAGISNSLENYVTYFDELLQDDFLLTADVSPSYMPIQAADLRAVIDAFNAKGIAVRVVLLLRDPVERLLSFGRMVKKLKFEIKGIGSVLETDMMTWLDALLTQTNFGTDYASSISNVVAATAEDERFIYPYEALTTPKGIAALSKALDVPEMSFFSTRVFNSSPISESNDLGIYDIQVLVDHLAPQYENCRRYFEGQKISLNWRDVTTLEGLPPPSKKTIG